MRARWKAGIAAAFALAALGAAASVHFLLAGPKTLTGPPGNPFRLDYPAAWQPLRRPELARMPGHPLAALDLAGGVASVTITRDVPAEAGPRLVRQVRDDFEERLADYRLLSARLLRTRAGEIFVYSYVAPDAPALHTDALVPAGNHSYLLASVARPGAKTAVDGIAAIIRSFRPT